MPSKEIHNPLYRFLIESKFRWCRHIVFIVSIGMIFVNHIYLTYEGQTDSISIHNVVALYILVVLLIMYLNLYWFIPQLLFKGKYLQYGLIVLVMVCCILVGDICAEYYIHQHFQIPFGQYSFFSEGRYTILDLLSNFFMFTLYLTSITAIVFYKHWLLNSRKLEQLRKAQLDTDLDNLKSRISVEFLLYKLDKAARFCNTAPSKVSLVLLQLSRVLRYQLYDCNRESVLLSSEIKFLNDFLTLEKNCNDSLAFKISYPKDLVNCFVPPLLFISFVEDSLRQLSQQGGVVWVDIEFSIVDSSLTFICSDNRNMDEIKENTVKHLAVCKRLNLLHSKNYSLTTELDEEVNQYKLIFQYQNDQKIESL